MIREDYIDLVEIAKKREEIKEYIDDVAHLESEREITRGEFEMLQKFDDECQIAEAFDQIYSGDVWSPKNKPKKGKEMVQNIDKMRKESWIITFQPLKTLYFKTLTSYRTEKRSVDVEKSEKREPTAITGILKTQSRQIEGTPTYCVQDFFSFGFLVQLYDL